MTTWSGMVRDAVSRIYVQLGATFRLSEVAGTLDVAPSEALLVMHAAQLRRWIRAEGDGYAVTDEGVAECMP